ncbi:putative multidrug and toxin extrusion protein 2-like [Capsicum annuum]|nr:putative multidrug and toxin extrusion protein 2-like [Capsicum annuum]
MGRNGNSTKTSVIPILQSNIKDTIRDHLPDFLDGSVNFPTILAFNCFFNASRFVPNGHSISKIITETFKERQDATGYTWRGVTEFTRKFYWNEFMETEMGRELNSWEIFKKVPPKKDGSFVDVKSKSINDKMEVVIATALSGSTYDSSEDQELDINRMCLGFATVVKGSEKFCARAIPTAMLGYSSSQKGYILYDLAPKSSCDDPACSTQINTLLSSSMDHVPLPVSSISTSPL